MNTNDRDFYSPTAYEQSINPIYNDRLWRIRAERLARIQNAKPSGMFQIKSRLESRRSSDAASRLKNIGLCNNTLVWPMADGRACQFLDLETGARNLCQWPGHVEGKLLGTAQGCFVIDTMHK